MGPRGPPKLFDCELYTCYTPQLTYFIPNTEDRYCSVYYLYSANCKFHNCQRKDDLETTLPMGHYNGRPRSRWLLIIIIINIIIIIIASPASPSQSPSTPSSSSSSVSSSLQTTFPRRPYNGRPRSHSLIITREL